MLWNWGHKLNILNLKTADDANCIFLTKWKLIRQQEEEKLDEKSIFMFFIFIAKQRRKENLTIKRIHDN